MADNPIKSDVFKFVALRPPVSIEKKNQEINFTTDNRQAEQTPFGKLAETFDPRDATKIPEQVKKFIEINKYDLNYPENVEDFNLSKISNFVLKITKNDFNPELLQRGIVDILDNEIANYLNSNETKILLENIWDRYYAFYFLATTENQNLETLTKNLRVLHLLQYIIKFKINDFDTLQKVIASKPIISKLFIDLPKLIIKTETVKKEEPKSEIINNYKKLWIELIDTYRAIEEFRNVRVANTITTEDKNITVKNKEANKDENVKLKVTKSNIVIDKKNFDQFHANTKSILQTLDLTNGIFSISTVLPFLQSRFNKLFQAAQNTNDISFINEMPAEAKLIPEISALVAKFGTNEPPVSYKPLNNIRSFLKPLGVGDLKVVKQTLKKYASGEVAHIENVLRGEYNERKYRTLDRTEDIFTVTEEKDEETTKDLQTTEKFELKKESEKTIQEQMSVQAGVTVSGSYGMVSFGATGNFAYSTSNQESNKSSSNFAREVIDKSVSKIQNKTKTERTTKNLHEVEEINTHGIDNKDKLDHAIGVYRWVDKYYEAQIYNYGKRMMFEFIIPEPAAFFEYAQSKKPKKNIIPPIVPYHYVQDADLKWVPDRIITHKDISELYYETYIRDYNVQGVTPPPPVYKTISTAVVKDAMVVDIRDENQPDRINEGPSYAVNNKELVVAAGYASKTGVWFDFSAIWTAFPKMELTVGDRIYRLLDVDRNPNNFDERFLAGNRSDRTDPNFAAFYSETIIQVSVNTSDVLSYTINLFAVLERLPETYENWQILTYEKIMAAYNLMQAEYEQKLAAQETAQGISIQGQNPWINRQIEKTELKKQCVKMLMDDTDFGTFDAMNADGIDFNIFEALKEGRTVQFFEQAFEWENMTYLFYPYFWARNNQWVHKLTTFDTDPLFTKFLQAGSSRVVLPVHPAYNDLIIYFINTNGKIWGQDGSPPIIQNADGTINELFISIADELRNQTDDLANATPEGEPWEVVLPTTLVYLQKDSDLPTF